MLYVEISRNVSNNRLVNSLIIVYSNYIILAAIKVSFVILIPTKLTNANICNFALSLITVTKLE